MHRVVYGLLFLFAAPFTHAQTSADPAQIALAASTAIAGATVAADPVAGARAAAVNVSLANTPVTNTDAAPQAQTSGAAPKQTASEAQTAPQLKSFFPRLKDAYASDWHPDPNAPATETPARVGYPAPVSAPPFPFTDWPYGGSPVIGVPDGNVYPLMEAIDENKSRIKYYGWFDAGFNVGTSNKGKYANAPIAYDVIPNSIQLDQAALYIERLPNEAQNDHVDWGFRIAQIYGLDYRYTTAKGIFSQQLLNSNNTYGYDPVMFYADFWIPHVAKGLNIRVGRYISLPDIEAQLAPNNYTYSHSLLYTYDCYTQTGAVATLKLSDHWQVQAGLSAGCEAAPWTKGDAQPTGTGCLSYTWTTGGDNLYLCANAINDGRYAYNNVQGYYLTWYHKIGKSSWHTSTEGWYQYERSVPNIAGNVANPLPTENGANGAFCNPGQRSCYAPDSAIVNYVERDFNHHHDSLNIRNEFVDDIRGQRTGFKTTYSEHLIGIDHWIGSTVTFRPELRLDHSYTVPAYDLGTKTTQFTVAGDVIYHF